MPVDLHDLLLKQQNLLLEKTNAREVFDHPGAKGDAVEFPWREVIDEFLPDRYCVNKAFLLDSNGNASEEIDLVIYDRQFSPLLFEAGDQRYIPAESVYAAFEIKPEVNRGYVLYAAEKVASVRRLHRTSVDIPHAGGIFAAKELPHIIGGLLTVDSGWSPAFGSPFEDALAEATEEGRLDIGCAVRAGGWEARYSDPGVSTTVSDPEAALMFFLLALFRHLRSAATVPALDLEAYGRSLEASGE
jgi:hypothetical protein